MSALISPDTQDFLETTGTPNPSVPTLGFQIELRQVLFIAYDKTARVIQA